MSKQSHRKSIKPSPPREAPKGEIKGILDFSGFSLNKRHDSLSDLMRWLLLPA
jgi:hypothetical protein